MARTFFKVGDHSTCSPGAQESTHSMQETLPSSKRSATDIVRGLSASGIISAACGLVLDC